MNILDVRTVYLNENCTARWAGELYTGGRGRVSGVYQKLQRLKASGKMLRDWTVCDKEYARIRKVCCMISNQRIYAMYIQKVNSWLSRRAKPFSESDGEDLLFATSPAA